MIRPKEGVAAEQFTLRNTSGKDARFTGWKLAQVSSHNATAQRWKERAVYQSQGGKIVLHKLGRSRVQGEVDRGDVCVVTTDADLLAQKEQDAALVLYEQLEGKSSGEKPSQESRAALRAAHEESMRALRANPPKAPSPESQIVAFFGEDPLAKTVYDALQIEHVEDLDDGEPTFERAAEQRKRELDIEQKRDQFRGKRAVEWVMLQAPLLFTALRDKTRASPVPMTVTGDGLAGDVTAEGVRMNLVWRPHSLADMNGLACLVIDVQDLTDCSYAEPTLEAFPDIDPSGEPAWRMEDTWFSTRALPDFLLRRMLPHVRHK